MVLKVTYIKKKKVFSTTFLRQRRRGWLETGSPVGGVKISGVRDSQQVPLSPHIPPGATVSEPGHPPVGSPTESGSHVARSRDTWPSDFADLRGDRNVARWEGALG